MFTTEVGSSYIICFANASILKRYSWDWLTFKYFEKIVEISIPLPFTEHGHIFLKVIQYIFHSWQNYTKSNGSARGTGDTMGTAVTGGSRGHWGTGYRDRVPLLHYTK